MTREELLADRTTEPLLEDVAFRALLASCWQEAQAEDYLARGKKRRRRGRSRKQVENVDAAFHNPDFDMAELR